MFPLMLRTFPLRAVCSPWIRRHGGGATQASAKTVEKVMTFTPSMTSHPIFERRGDECIWRLKDATPKSMDLIAQLRSTPWIDIVSPEIRQSLDDHTMRSDAHPANYLVGWSGILRRLLPSSSGYTLNWEVIARHGVQCERLTVSKADRYGNERVVLLVLAHSDYPGIGDYKEYMKWRVSFLESIIDRWTGEAVNSGEAGERLPWIGVMGHRFILGVKDRYSGINRIGKESNSIFDVCGFRSKPVLLNFVKNIQRLVL